jgi:hypothetical protein
MAPDNFGGVPNPDPRDAVQLEERDGLDLYSKYKSLSFFDRL